MSIEEFHILESESLNILKSILDRNKYSLCRDIPALLTVYQVLNGLFCKNGRNLNNKSINSKSDDKFIPFHPVYYIPFHPVYREAFREEYFSNYILWRMFFLGQKVPGELLAGIMENKEIDLLQKGFLINETDGEIESRFLITPFEGMYIMSSFLHRAEHDQVYIGGDSKYMADRLKRDLKYCGGIEKALDIGTGSGIQAMVLSRFCRNVVTVDINPRTLEIARANACLNGINNIEFVLSDLYEELENSVFDIITTNPPYVYTSELGREVNWAYGGEGYGTDIPMRILKGAENHLSPDGKLFMVSVSPEREGRDIFADRIREDFSGLDFSFDYQIYDITRILPEQDFQRKHGISHLNCLYLEMKRSDQPYYKIRKIPGVLESFPGRISAKKILLYVLEKLHFMGLSLKIALAKHLRKKMKERS